MGVSFKVVDGDLSVSSGRFETVSMVITVARVVGTGTLSIQDGDGGNIAIWCDDLGPYNSTNLGTDL